MDIQTATNRCIGTSADRAKNTARMYRRALDLFCQMLVEHGIQTTDGLEQISMEAFIDFPGWLVQSQGFSKATRNAYVSGVKYFLDWLILQGVLEPTYGETVRYQKAVERAGKKQETRLPREPKEGAVQKIQAAVRLLPLPSPIRERNIALIELLASSGCRNSEAAALKVSSIDLDECSARIVGKGNKEQILYFSAVCAEALQVYWRARGGANRAQYAFWRHDDAESEKTHHSHINTNTVRNIVDAAAAMAGIPKGQFTPHYFRHAFATRMLQATGNPILVKELLGHASVTSTERYTHTSRDELRDAHHRVFST